MEKIKSTTVVAIRHNGEVVIGADGQATLGNTVAKSTVKKLRVLQGGKIVTGFAGSTADAFTLLEKFEEKLGHRQRATPPRPAPALRPCGLFSQASAHAFASALTRPI